MFQLFEKKFKQRLSELESEYKDVIGLILSESDLKVHVFRKIFDLFLTRYESYDAGHFASPIHTEIKFFDENNVLSLIPDITILNPKNLSVVHSLQYEVKDTGIIYYKTSGKEFEFNGDLIIIELKFCKNKKGIVKENIKSFQKDIEKIKRIKKISNWNNYAVKGFLIIFNKTNRKHIDVENFINDFQEDGIEILYYSGDFSPNLK